MADTSFGFDEGLLRCGVCREFLGPPIFQCKDGHYACIKCWEKKNNRCHVCRSRIDKSIRNVGIEKVVGSLKRKCDFWEHGCREMVAVWRGDTATKHRKSCAHWPHHCPLLGCTFHGPLHQFSSHFQESHNIRTVHFSYGDPFTLPLGAPQCGPHIQDTWHVKYPHQKFVLLKDTTANPMMFLFCFHDSHPIGIIFYISSFCFDPSFSSVPLAYDFPKNSCRHKYRLRYVSDAKTLRDRSADISIKGVIMKHLNASSCTVFDRMISSGAHFLLVPKPFVHLSGSVTVTIFPGINYEQTEENGSEEDKEDVTFPHNKKQATQENESDKENGSDDDKEDGSDAEESEDDEENVSDKEIV